MIFQQLFREESPCSLIFFPLPHPTTNFNLFLKAQTILHSYVQNFFVSVSWNKSQGEKSTQAVIKLDKQDLRDRYWKQTLVLVSSNNPKHAKSPLAEWSVTEAWRHLPSFAEKSLSKGQRQLQTSSTKCHRIPAWWHFNEHQLFPFCQDFQISEDNMTLEGKASYLGHFIIAINLLPPQKKKLITAIRSKRRQLCSDSCQRSVL